MIKSHKDLKVWQLSIDLVVIIYEITKEFPVEEKFGLTNQVRRAAVSIPSNIAEGAGRNGNKEFIKFLFIALGSLAELETQIYIAEKLNYIKHKPEIEKTIIYIRRMMANLIKKLKENEEA